MKIFLFLLLGYLAVLAFVGVCYLLTKLKGVLTIAALIMVIYITFYRDSPFIALAFVFVWLYVEKWIDGMDAMFKEDENEATKENHEVRKPTKPSWIKELLFNRKKTYTKKLIKKQPSIQHTHPSHYHPHSSSSEKLGLLLMCIVPIFWPILIIRLFFGSKHDKHKELDEYDYEQHLKCNRRL